MNSIIKKILFLTLLCSQLVFALPSRKCDKQEEWSEILKVSGATVILLAMPISQNLKILGAVGILGYHTYKIWDISQCEITPTKNSLSGLPQGSY